MLLWSGVAHAHIGDVLAGLGVFTPTEGTQQVSIEASYGLILADEGEFRWICHEAVSDFKNFQPKKEGDFPEPPRYARSPDGSTWLSAVFEPGIGRGGQSLFHSPDGGCSWNDAKGLPTGAVVSDVAYHPADGALARAVSATKGAENAIWWSKDGGATWVSETKPDADRRFHSVLLQASGAVATATNAAGSEAYVWRLEKEAWVERPVPLPAGDVDTALSLVAVDGTAMWVVAKREGDDRLLHSGDGGETWEALLSDIGEINSGVVVDGDLMVITNDGLAAHRVAADGTIRTLADFVPSLGVAQVNDELVWSVLTWLRGPLLSVSDLNGEGFETTAFPDNIVGPVSCSAGTDMADVCEPLWPSLEPRLRGFDIPIDDETGDSGLASTDKGNSGCGCTSLGGSASWLWVVGLGGLMLARRRRG